MTKEAYKKKQQQKQAELDEQKWLESEKQGRDMTGEMPYCEFCKAHTCDQHERETECLCARAFNRMKRGTK